MRNLLKADFYRTSKSKSLYIVLALCFIFVLMSTLLFKGLDIVSTTMAEEQIPMQGEMADISEISNTLMQGLNVSSAFSVMKENFKSDTLFYCLIVVFLMISATEFSSGTIKNSLIAGIKRKNIYFSKWIVTCIYGSIYYVGYFISVIICGMLVYGQVLSIAEISEILLIGLKQLPIFVGVVTLGHALVFSTQSTVLSTVLYIVDIMIFNSILPMFNMVLDLKVDMTLLFPLYQCIALTNDSISAIDYATIYGSTMIYILLSLWLGYAMFKKSEIK